MLKQSDNCRQIGKNEKDSGGVTRFVSLSKSVKVPSKVQALLKK